MQLLDGRRVSRDIKLRISEEIADKALTVNLAIVLVGDDAASRVYANSAVKAFNDAGMGATIYEYDASFPQDKLEELVEKLNKDDSVNGIIIQMPLPDNIDKTRLIEKIAPNKDVDCLTSCQMGLLFMNKAKLFVCTPYAVMLLLREYKIDVSGKNVVVIGRSNIVGKPMSMMLLNEDATVSMCHKLTKDVPSLTRHADIIVVAAGVPRLITADMVSEGAVVIDVGINRDESGIVGDVDFENVAPKCSFITPVPGGVGSMTVAMLMLNTLNAYKLQNGKEIREVFRQR